MRPAGTSPSSTSSRVPGTRRGRDRRGRPGQVEPLAVRAPRAVEEDDALRPPASPARRAPRRAAAAGRRRGPRRWAGPRPRRAATRAGRAAARSRRGWRPRAARRAARAATPAPERSAETSGRAVEIAAAVGDDERPAARQRRDQRGDGAVVGVHDVGIGRGDGAAQPRPLGRQAPRGGALGQPEVADVHARGRARRPSAAWRR